MACLKPMCGFKYPNGNFSVRRATYVDQVLDFERFSSQHKKIESSAFDLFPIPCGSCINCRLSYSREWSIRLMHERQMFDKACFVTLTYDNEHLPSDKSVSVTEMQLFVKRLRKFFSGVRIRFFGCGEYGAKFSRPHYHLILFGIDFSDKSLIRVFSSSKFPLYKSDILSKLWPFGFCSVGAVSFESCAYVARYVVKKVTGSVRNVHYSGRSPEFARMSRMPGIGADWFEKHWSDVFPHDRVIIRKNALSKPPRYYLKLLEKSRPGLYYSVMKRRYDYCKDLESNFYFDVSKGFGSNRIVYYNDRSDVLVKCAEVRFSRLLREYESVSLVS